MGMNHKKVKCFFKNNFQKILKKQKTPVFRDFLFNIKHQVFHITIVKSVKKLPIRFGFYRFAHPNRRFVL